MISKHFSSKGYYKRIPIVLKMNNSVLLLWKQKCYKKKVLVRAKFNMENRWLEEQIQDLGKLRMEVIGPLSKSMQAHVCKLWDKNLDQYKHFRF